MAATAGAVRPTHARNAVAWVFALNGFAFATWVSRVPDVRARLDLSPGELGVLLLALSVGSVVALPSTGRLVGRFGAARVVRAGAVLDGVGLAVAGLGGGGLGLAWVTACGLLLLGLGTGAWDVAMNVEGAAVERVLGRSLMPRLHAAFSLGTVAGAGAGSAMSAASVGPALHLVVVGAVAAAGTARAVPFFLRSGGPGGPGPRGGRTRHAWTEPRTLLIGVLVLVMALTEGVANDWLAVALVDGYRVPAWAGAAGFAVFVAAMTTGRTVGTTVLDRFGRRPVLWSTMAAAGCGVLLVVLGAWLPLVAVGIALWGLGTSLGFPVGMSAAADEPASAAARVSVVATIGYLAFLAGPPVVGWLGGRYGVLHALVLVPALLVPALFVVGLVYVAPGDDASAERGSRDRSRD